MYSLCVWCLNIYASSNWETYVTPFLSQFALLSRSLSLSRVATNDPNFWNYVDYYTYLSNITTRKTRPRPKMFRVFPFIFVNDCQSNVRYILGIHWITNDKREISPMRSDTILCDRFLNFHLNIHYFHKYVY